MTPAEFCCASHSPCIGGLSELVNLQFSKPWTMHRLDWLSEATFAVYFDSRILLTEYSESLFGHLRRAVAVT